MMALGFWTGVVVGAAGLVTLLTLAYWWFVMTGGWGPKF